MEPQHGTSGDDTDRAHRGLDPKWRDYLDAPLVFYVLFDRSANDSERLRVRAWCVDAQRDEAWRDLFERFVKLRAPRQYNLQLHPPVGYDDDIVVNTVGNLDFRQIKVFEADFRVPADPAIPLDLRWVVPPSEGPRDGRTAARPYGGRDDRRSRLEGVAGFELEDEAVIARLFPFLSE